MKKKKIIKIVLFLLLGAGLITAGIYAYFLSWWAYLPFFNKGKVHAVDLNAQISYTASPSKTPEPTASPTPSNTTKSQDSLKSTPTPLPTPTPHPGDRDNKFSDGDIVMGDMSYSSSDLSIEITKHESELITYYVAEVYYRTNENYFSAFSYSEDNDRIEKTSEILAESNGMLAISGDNYNARDYGLIIRNGILYRKHSSTDIMAVFDNGTMKTYPVKGISADELLEQGALHTYSFGPNLFEYGKPIEDFKGLTSLYLRNLQPRCAVGMVEPYHYIFVVVDGRAPDYSQGVTMEELSKIMHSLGCVDAYNLDGWGFSHHGL